MHVAYTGHETLTFTDYVNQETGKVLTAEPGGTYDIAPASGRNAADIPPGWFVPAELPAPVKGKTVSGSAALAGGLTGKPDAEDPRQP